MAVNLSPVGGVAAQFFTNTGAVLTGGKLFTYLAGTTTPATAYTSSNGSTAWTNPIVLDAAGRVPSGGEIWITDGISYKFVLKDSTDVLIATYDNITGINSNSVSFTNQQQIITATAGQTVFNLSISFQPGTNSLSVFVDGVNQYGPGAQYAYTETDADTVTFVSGLHVGAEVKFTTTQQQGAGAVDSSQVTYDPPFTGSVATNVEAKLAQTVSIKDFGAVGDGTTDDTTAIQTAINNASLGCDIVFPAAPNGYLISSTITLNRNVRLVFQGARAVTAIGPVLPGSYLLKKSTMTTAGVSITYNGAAWSGGGVVGQSGNAGDGIVLLANNVILDQVCAISCGNDGIRIGSDSSGFNANIFKITMPVCSYNGRHGIYINDNNPGTGPDANIGDGINIGAGWFNTIIGPLCEVNSTGIRLQNGSVSNTIIGGDSEANTVDDIIIDAGAQSNCFFGTFIGAGVPGIVDNGNASIILGQYVNKLGAVMAIPVTGKSVEINAAGNSIYLDYMSDAVGAKEWKTGDGIVAAGTFSIYDVTDLRHSLGVTSAGVSTYGYVRPGTPAGAVQTASGLTAGTGAPSNADGQNGDFYFRSDGGASTSVYMKRAGSWVGIV
jgi:hypothetical protein